MLGKVMQHIKNWFVLPDGKHFGTFTIKGGGISLPFLCGNQYFRIVGSVFNDGVYKYPTKELTDETFKGAIWALAVPKDFIETVNKIQEFNASDAARPSPYVSESFKNYSYTKATDSNGAGLSWQTVFATKLNKWRKFR